MLKVDTFLVVTCLHQPSLTHTSFISLNTQTAGGILLPESSMGKSNEGSVLAVGPGFTTRDGDLIAPSVSVGDKVLLPEFGGMPIKVMDDEDIFLFRNEEILAKVEK